jgi:transcriptional regulator with XRE-family HTH domain
MKGKKNVPRETPEQAQIRKVGRVFLNKRYDLGLNLLDVEKAAGVSSLTISKMERGQLDNCSLELLNKVAKALDLKITITIT